MENDIDELKNKISYLEKCQMDHLEETLHTIKNQTEVIEVFSKFIKIFKKFLSIFSWTVLFLVALIFREQINGIILWIIQRITNLWNHFSENWQIAFFTIFGTAVISVASIYLDRRFRK